MCEKPFFCAGVCFEVVGLQDAKRTRPTVQFDESCGSTFGRNVNLHAAMFTSSLMLGCMSIV